MNFALATGKDSFGLRSRHWRELVRALSGAFANWLGCGNGLLVRWGRKVTYSPRVSVIPA